MLRRDDGYDSRAGRQLARSRERAIEPELRLTIVDRAIGYVSPKAGLRRAQSRAQMSVLKRSYEGASLGRRTEGWRTPNRGANSEIGPALTRLRSRSRDLVRNNGYARAALTKLVTNIVGDGVRPFAATGDKERDKVVDDFWASWATEPEFCDFDGQLDFDGLQDLALRTSLEAGEAVAVYRFDERGSTASPIPLQIQILEPDHIDTSKNGRLRDGGVIINGIEFGPDGKRRATWLFADHPGETVLSAGRSRQSKPIPAAYCQHLYRKLRPSQVRGVPFLAAVMLRLRDLDEFQDARLLQMKVAACFAAFVTNATGESEPSGIGVGGTRNEANERIDQIEPGMVKYLKQGEEVTHNSPPAASGYREYVATELRGISAGVDVMYEQMSGDLQGVTFSSLRQGTLEFRRFAGAMQKHVLIAGFNRPVWRRVMSIGQLAGALPPGASAAEWIAPRWGALQPLQDVQADMLAGRAGFESIPKIIKRYGNRPDRQLEEMADFAGELDGANLIIDSDARRTSRAGLTQSRTALELGGEDGGDQGDGDAGGSEPSTEG